MRDALLSCADALLTSTAVTVNGSDDARPAPTTDKAHPHTQSMHEQVHLAKGDDVTYGTVYTGLNDGAKRWFMRCQVRQSGALSHCLGSKARKDRSSLC